jgi:hypothetical protein
LRSTKIVPEHARTIAKQALQQHHQCEITRNTLSKLIFQQPASLTVSIPKALKIA